MSSAIATRKLLCASCRNEQNHLFVYDKTHNEILAECTACKHTLKWHGDLSEEDFLKALDLHNEHNIGQRPAEPEEAPYTHHKLLESLRK